VENDILTTPFIEEEVSASKFQMEHNKASKLDGFLVKFYQAF
jgi:hypothetical protein